MFVRLAKAYELIERLNAEYYSPASVENQKKIDRIGTERFDLFYGKTGIGHTASVEPHYAASGERSVHFASGKAIRDGIFDIDKCEKIKLSSHQGMLSKSRVSAGDLLVIRKGDSGSSCVIPESVGECNCSSEVIYFKDISPLDAYFVSTFLNSSHGKIAFKRLQRGTLIPGVSLLDIPEFGIVDIDEDAKKYIGDKVRQAERLRAWAKHLKGEVDNQIESLELPYDSTPEMINKVAYGTLSDRLDPRPYRTHSLGLVEEIKKIHNSQLSDCVFMSSGCPVSSKDFVENFDVPLVRIRNIGSDEFSGLDIGVSTVVYQAAIKYSAKPGHVVIGMDGDFRAQFFLEAELPMLINQRVAVFKPKDIRPELLTHWLNRPEGQIQLYQWAVKTTVDHTSLTDLKKVRIPRFESEREEELADMLLSARLARYYARKLTVSAKFLVEALIEGAITEQQLIDAQKVLEADDTSLDRKILARLTTKGLDADGDPLFSDLDQLYDLLAQSQSLDE